MTVVIFWQRALFIETLKIEHETTEHFIANLPLCDSSTTTSSSDHGRIGLAFSPSPSPTAAIDPPNSCTRSQLELCRRPASVANARMTSSMFSDYFGSIPRSPNLNATLVTPRDDHERERMRWQSKLSDLEQALKQSEESNAELTQCKADLIRKLKESEKTQKNLQETARKLAEKVKSAAVTETKKYTEKLKQSEDEISSLKQAMEKLTTECIRLKQRKLTASKEEEITRLKSQNVEYCKCIAALKQAALEKDKKIISLQDRNHNGDRLLTAVSTEVDLPSMSGSDYFASNTSLETTADDKSGVQSKKRDKKGRSPFADYLDVKAESPATVRGTKLTLPDGSLTTETATPSDRLSAASSATATGLLVEWQKERHKYRAIIQQLQETVNGLRETQKKLALDLQETKEINEVLEFRILEYENAKDEANETLQSVTYDSAKDGIHNSESMCDKSVDTSLDSDFESAIFMDEEPFKELPPEELKIRLVLLQHKDRLNEIDRKVICQTREQLETLQNEHSNCTLAKAKFETLLKQAQINAREEHEKRIRKSEQENEEELKKSKVKAAIKEIEFFKEENRKLKEEIGRLDGKVQNLVAELDDNRRAYESSSWAQKHEHEIVEHLKKQIDAMKEGRGAELDIMNELSNKRMTELKALRAENDSLREQLTCSTSDVATLNALLVEKSEQHQKAIQEMWQKLEGHEKLLEEVEALRNYSSQLKLSLKESQTRSDTLAQHLAEPLDYERSGMGIQGKAPDDINYAKSITRVRPSLDGDMPLVGRSCSVACQHCLLPTADTAAISKRDAAVQVAGTVRNGALMKLKALNLDLSAALAESRLYSQNLEAQITAQIAIIDIIKSELLKAKLALNETVQQRPNDVTVRSDHHRTRQGDSGAEDGSEISKSDSSKDSFDELDVDHSDVEQASEWVKKFRLCLQNVFKETISSKRQQVAATVRAGDWTRNLCVNIAETVESVVTKSFKRRLVSHTRPSVRAMLQQCDKILANAVIADDQSATAPPTELVHELCQVCATLISFIGIRACSCGQNSKTSGAATCAPEIGKIFVGLRNASETFDAADCHDTDGFPGWFSFCFQGADQWPAGKHSNDDHWLSELSASKCYEVHSDYSSASSTPHSHSSDKCPPFIEPSLSEPCLRAAAWRFMHSPESDDEGLRRSSSCSGSLSCAQADICPDSGRCVQNCITAL